MKPRRCLAILVLGVCVAASSGCAHLLTDPGFPTSARDAHDRSHLQRMEGENTAYSGVVRETAK